MRRTRLLLLFLFSYFASYAQTPDTYYLFNKDWKEADVKTAFYLLIIKKVNDTCWQHTTYHFMGACIGTEQFMEREGKTAHGTFTFYNAKGVLDSIRTFRNGLAHGEWVYKNDTGRNAYAKIFREGKVIGHKDLIHESDSIQKAWKETEHLLSESEFIGQQRGWARYLGANMKYPERALNGQVGGIVWVQFVVGPDGSVQNVELAKSVEFSLDEEAMRLIRLSPKWKPAEVDGKKVRSYKKQPIEFKIE